MSDQAKPTPGPWTVDDADSDAFEIFGPNLGTIAYLSVDSGSGSGLRSREEDEANARLIAAAPDLLEACEAALTLIEVDYEMEDRLDDAYIISSLEGEDMTETMRAAASPEPDSVLGEGHWCVNVYALLIAAVAKATGEEPKE